MLNSTTPQSSATKLPEPEEFEIVLGRRQVAGVLFVAIVIVSVFCAMSYLVGKAAAPTQPVIVMVRPPPAPPPPVPVVQAADPVPEPALFAEPVKGAVYLQMGAVEKGVALILTEGLRKLDFQAFAAPGPDQRTFRVLIGPMPNVEAFQRTKNAVDQIGLSTFARKYPN